MNREQVCALIRDRVWPRVTGMIHGPIVCQIIQESTAAADFQITRSLKWDLLSGIRGSIMEELLDATKEVQL